MQLGLIYPWNTVQYCSTMFMHEKWQLKKLILYLKFMKIGLFQTKKGLLLGPVTQNTIVPCILDMKMESASPQA